MRIVMSKIAHVASNLYVPFSKTQGASTLMVLIVGIGTLYAVRSIYRRHFHPLSQFPGAPEAASSTKWLYKTNRQGFPQHEFERLHKKYRTPYLWKLASEFCVSC